MKSIIQLEQVEKHFSTQVALHPLSLSVKEAEFLTILGPSGCGKTTLLRIIAGFEEPTRGEVYLDGKPITRIPPYRRNMNMVFQHYALFPHMTVEDNILFGLKMKGVPLQEQRKRLAETLEFTHLEEYRHRKPRQLSGGQQQRVAIARAIINNPQVLLLDEPLGALDFQLRKKLQMELKNLQRELGITFIYVTHDQDEAMTISDRIVILNQGKVEQLGTPGEIYLKPRNIFVANFIGENNIFKVGSSTFSVRPEKIQLTKKGTGENSSGRSGVVKDIVFQGNYYKVYIQLETEATTVIAYNYSYQKTTWLQGEKVQFTWDPEDEVILKC